MLSQAQILRNGFPREQYRNQVNGHHFELMQNWFINKYGGSYQGALSVSQKKDFVGAKKRKDEQESNLRTLKP